MNNGDEVYLGTDPSDNDTDNDSVNDGIDIDPLVDIRVTLRLLRLEAYNTGDELFTNELDISFKISL